MATGSKKSDEENNLGEVIAANNGEKQIYVTRKSFETVYRNKGYSIGEFGSEPADEGDEADGSETEENLTPHQKAARTKAAKKALLDAQGDE